MRPPRREQRASVYSQFNGGTVCVCGGEGGYQWTSVAGGVPL